MRVFYGLGINCEPDGYEFALLREKSLQHAHVYAAGSCTLLVDAEKLSLRKRILHACFKMCNSALVPRYSAFLHLLEVSWYFTPMLGVEETRNRASPRPY